MLNAEKDDADSRIRAKPQEEACSRAWRAPPLPASEHSLKQVIVQHRDHTSTTLPLPRTITCRSAEGDDTPRYHLTRPSHDAHLPLHPPGRTDVRSRPGA